MKKTILAACILFFLMTQSVCGIEQAEEEIKQPVTERGKVLEVITHLNQDDLNADMGSFVQERQIVRVEVLTGKYRGNEYIVENNLGSNEYYNIRVKQGDEILLAIDENSRSVNVYISSYSRDKYQLAAIILFAVLLIITGGKQGLKSIFTLSFTIAVIFKVMVPFILKGYNPIFVSVITCGIVTAVTFFVIGGINIKSVSAVTGTMLGVVFAGIIAYAAGTGAKLTGVSSDESIMLLYLPSGIKFNLRELLFSGIIVGTLGAVMDVSMSVASAMNEIKEIKPDISIMDLFKSGMNVGRDIMGTMTNTLILAYTGSSLALILIFAAYKRPFIEILNLDIIATEVIRSVAGSIGIILAVPFTALITGILEYRYKKIPEQK